MSAYRQNYTPEPAPGRWERAENAFSRLASVALRLALVAAFVILFFVIPAVWVSRIATRGGCSTEPAAPIAQVRP